ncbi:MAG: DUF2304 domain-containing protein [Candidatus Omnitrophota bacterium]
MAPRLELIAIIISFVMLSGIIELVRRGKLKEEYSFLWLLTGFVLLIVVVKFNLLVRLTRLIGIVTPVNTLFFFGLLFVILLCLHYSLKISQLTVQVKSLAQKLALLEAEHNETKNSNTAR